MHSIVEHQQLHAQQERFLALVAAEFGLAAPLKGKLTQAASLEWKAWSAALEKELKRKLSLGEKQEWLPVFQQHAAAVQARRQRIAAADARLDALVYQLYGLTPAEIALVEGRAAAPAPAEPA